MKKLLVLIVAAAFIFSVTSLCLAAYEFYRGTITKISGDKITIKDSTGKSRTVSSQAFGGRGFKVGDKVSGKVDAAGVHTIEGIETESDIVEYKDGEDGVNRTPPGNTKPDNKDVRRKF
jgi:hypothetical protein